MGMREKIKAKREELAARVKESQDSASGFPSVIDKEIAKKLSGGREVPIWRPKEGDHIIDIIPFFAGKQHSLAPGKFAHNREFYAHYNIGAIEESFVCPARTKVNGKPIGDCPICQYLTKHDIRNTDEKLWDKIKPRQRVLYLVWVHNTQKDEDAGVQILDFAHWFLEQKLADISRNPRKGGSIIFADPDNGKSIMFSKSGSGISTKVVGHRFDDRPEPISDEILEQMFPLDEILKLDVTYQEIADAFSQGIDDAPAPEEPEDDIPYTDDEDIDDEEVPFDEENDEEYVEKEEEKPEPARTTRRRAKANPPQEKEEAPASRRRRR